MNNRIAKTIPIALALILMLTLTAGCPPSRQAEEAPVAEPRTITITDSAGREVEVPLPLERVVVISISTAELIHALGAADTIIGVSERTARDEALPGFHETAVVSHGMGELDYEQVIQLAPQLVITWGTHPRFDVVALADTMAPAGIPVVGVDGFRLATLFADIEILGELFERQAVAGRLIEFLQAPLDLIEGRVDGLSTEERVRVYGEHHGRPFMAFGPGSDWHRMIETVGGVNIFADVGRPFVDVDPEKVIIRNPQVILNNTRFRGFGATDFVPIREHRQGLIARPGWENLDAVKAGRVYLISMDLAFGPATVALHLYVGKILHPELFADVDPEGFLREYFEEFHGVELRGIFIYPQP